MNGHPEINKLAIITHALTLLAIASFSVPAFAQSEKGYISTEPAADSNQQIVVPQNTTVTFVINNGVDVVNSCTGTFQNGSPPSATISGSTSVTFGSTALGHNNECDITISTNDAEGNTCTSSKTIKFYVIVPKIIANSSDIYYFNGEVGGPQSSNTLDLSIEPTSGIGLSWAWLVTNGDDKVSIDPDGTTATLTSTLFSTTQNDVTVTLSSGGSNVATKNFTVLDANSGTTTNVEYSETSYTVFGFGTYPGWETDYYQQCLDQFSASLPDGTPINEKLGDLTNLYLPNDWPGGSPVAGPIEGSEFIDDYSIGGYPTWYPQPVWIGQPGDSTGVTSRPQQYYAGSTSSGAGSNFKSITLVFARGRAAQD
jgi:hypothetical protein